MSWVVRTNRVTNVYEMAHYIHPNCTSFSRKIGRRVLHWHVIFVFHPAITNSLFDKMVCD